MDGAILAVLAFVIIAVLMVFWSNLQRILWWEPIRQRLNRSGRKPDTDKKESWCDD
jgi:hypothetical protein